MDKNMKNLVESISALFGNEGVTVKAFENGRPVVDIENGVNKLNDAIKTQKESLENNPDYVKFPKKGLTPVGLEHFDCEETKDKDYVFIPKEAAPVAKAMTGMGEVPSEKPSFLDVIKSALEEACNGSEESVEDEKEDKPCSCPTDAIKCPTEPKNEDSEDDEFGPGERFTELTKNISKDDFDETYIIRDSVNGNRIVSETEISFDYTAEDGITTPGITDEDLLLILMYRHRKNGKVFELLKEAMTNL